MTAKRYNGSEVSINPESVKSMTIGEYGSLVVSLSDGSQIMAESISM